MTRQWFFFGVIFLSITSSLPAQDEPREILRNALNVLYRSTVSYDMRAAGDTTREPMHYLIRKNSDGSVEGVYNYPDETKFEEYNRKGHQFLYGKFDDENDYTLLLSDCGSYGYVKKRYSGKTPFELLEESTGIEKKSIVWKDMPCWKIVQTTANGLRGEYVIDKKSFACYSIKNYAADGKYMLGLIFEKYNFNPDVKQEFFEIPSDVKLYYATGDTPEENIKWREKVHKKVSDCLAKRRLEFRGRVKLSPFQKWLYNLSRGDTLGWTVRVLARFVVPVAVVSLVVVAVIKKRVNKKP